MVQPPVSTTKSPDNLRSKAFLNPIHQGKAPRGLVSLVELVGMAARHLRIQLAVADPVRVHEPGPDALLLAALAGRIAHASH